MWSRLQCCDMIQFAAMEVLNSAHVATTWFFSHSLPLAIMWTLVVINWVNVFEKYKLNCLICAYVTQQSFWSREVKTRIFAFLTKKGCDDLGYVITCLRRSHPSKNCPIEASISIDASSLSDKKGLRKAKLLKPFMIRPMMQPLTANCNLLINPVKRRLWQTMEDGQ